MNFLIKTIAVTLIFGAMLGNVINYSSAEDNTSESENIKALVLNGVEVVGKDIVELKFATDILDDDERDIVVRLLGDSPKEIFVSDFNIVGNSVKLILEEELESNKDYEVIIFSITAQNGATITSGLDGAIKFSSLDLSRFEENIEEENIEEENTVEENTVEENTVEENTVEENIVEEKIEEEINLESASPENEKNIGGENVEKKEMDKNIEVAASEKKELVKTGPEHILLLVLSLLFAGLIGYKLKSRKLIKVSK